MVTKPSFSEEIASLLHAVHANSVKTCIQCGTCSGSCPVARFMDYTPRKVIAMINAGLKDLVLAGNTFWYCASCYSCTVRCPRGIDIAELMYALKRYSIWKNQYKEGLVGPVFSETFVKTILKSGRSYEPVLATSYLFTFGVQEFLQEAQTATSLMLKGRIPVLRPRIKRLENFRRMVRRIIPLGGD
ncbi:MAG: 4Fe-4S dicluster domain-containing protein [Bacteroidetes bacterium]|nr:4Fe-4S dicluster domain-containing protein [Pseudomonadota bacterium]MBU2444471.1 4Fe-4S dicluster domain-containing protein [Bacteroidota bacterium]